jgi:hypothetical protein
MAQSEKPKAGKRAVGRRDFLRALGAGAAVSATAPLAGEAEAADNVSAADMRKARYRESEEVKTYYRVNRYP